MRTAQNFKIGLKLWSTDGAILPEAVRLYDERRFDYIELYIVPGTYSSESKKWGSFLGEYVIHCPHGGNGFNLADSDLRENNHIKFQEVQTFADRLKADSIIVHLGNNGSLDEAILQIKGLNDNRICVENKPIEGLNGEVCVGCTPEDVEKVLQESHTKGFVLDFGHAIYAANTLKIDLYDFIENFLPLDPKIFHLSDGLINSTKDCHFNLGEGDFDLSTLISFVHSGSSITLETPHNKEMGLGNFLKDLQFLACL